jgi:uncharacterized protein YaiL (DUF2058 family)
MASSLQDQLLKAGLVTEEQLEEVRGKGSGAEARRRRKGAGVRAGRGKVDRGKADRGKADRGKGGQGQHGQDQARRQSSPRAATDGSDTLKARPAGRTGAPSDKRRLRQRVRTLVGQRSLNVEGAETPYNFLRGKRVKRLYVTDEQRTALLAGQLVIVEVYGLHHVVEPDALEALGALLPEVFVHRNGEHADAPGGAAEGVDDYAGYEVPDDLVW